MQEAVVSTGGEGEEDDYEVLEDFNMKDYKAARRGRNLPFAVYPEVLGKYISCLW